MWPSGIPRQGRLAPAARRGCVRIRPGCRYGVGAVRLSTTGRSGTRRRSPALCSTVCMRRPMPITWALLCSRPSLAVSSLNASALRTPGTLFAAISSPFPEPPITMPRLPGCATVFSAAAIRTAGNRPWGRDVAPQSIGSWPALRRCSLIGCLSSNPAWSDPR